MKAIIGHSDDVLAEDAIAEVITQCRAQLGDEQPKAALVFMSVDYDHQVVLAAIAREWPDLPTIGGTSDGEVSSREGFVMDSVLVTLLCGDGLRAWAGVGQDLSLDIDASIDAAFQELPPGFSPSVGLTTFAPSTDASAVLACVDRRLPAATCPLFGGLTGDHREFSRMKEFCGTEVHSDSFPVLLLAGDIQVSWGIGSGWDPIGPAFTITQADGHLVQQIDGKPALDLYSEYYGEVPQGHLAEYPLAVSTDGPQGPWQLRAVIGTERESGVVRLVAGAPEGALVRMTEVVRDGLLSGTMKSIDEALSGFTGEPDVALLFTCAARKWVLGTRAADELETVRQALPAAANQVLGLAGLYVYGEIAPANIGGPPRLHNETCITVLLGAA